MRDDLLTPDELSLVIHRGDHCRTKDDIDPFVVRRGSWSGVAAAQIRELPWTGIEKCVPEPFAVDGVDAGQMVFGVVGSVLLALPEARRDEDAALADDGTRL